jgi:hypothetical protein
MLDAFANHSEPQNWLWKSILQFDSREIGREQFWTGNDQSCVVGFLHFENKSQYVNLIFKWALIWQFYQYECKDYLPRLDL